MWQRADQILEQATSDNALFFGLVVLTEAIKTRWAVLEGGNEARQGIKNFIVKVSTHLCPLASADPGSLCFGYSFPFAVALLSFSLSLENNRLQQRRGDDACRLLKSVR